MGRADFGLPAIFSAGRRPLARHGGLPRFAPLQLDADVRAFFRALGPATLGSMGTQVAMFADTIIATFLPAGALSALYYAERLYQFPIGVIGIAIGTVLLPEMSRRITAGDDIGAAAAQRRAFEFTLLAAIPFVAAFLTVPDVIMRAVFVRGAFTSADAAAAGATLAAYAVGLIPFVMIRSAVSAFYARKDTATPVKASLTGIDVQRAVENPADGIAGAGRPGAGDRRRRLDQFAAGLGLCGAGRLSRSRQDAVAVAGEVCRVCWRRAGGRIVVCRPILAAVQLANLSALRDVTALLSCWSWSAPPSMQRIDHAAVQQGLVAFAGSQLKPFALVPDPLQYSAQIWTEIGDTMAPIKFGVGQSVLRKEDDALIRGKGRYTDDYAPQPAALHALVLRSPHAHAKFTIDIARARGLPGVGAILTADDVRDIGDLPCLFNLETDPFHWAALSDSRARRGTPCRRRRRLSSSPTRSIRPATRSRRSRSSGRRCRRWSASPMRSRKARRRSGRDHSGNVLFDVPIGDKKATDAAFAKAHAVAEISIVNPRVDHQLHGDPRGGLRIRRQARSPDADHRQPGQPSPARNHRRHGAEDPAGKDAGDLPGCRRRVRHQAVSVSRIRLIAVAARKLRKTIKWTADRSDHFMGDAQGRDNVTTARMALAEDGKFLAMDVDLMGDMGAYLSTFGPYIPHGGAGMLPGLYDIQAFHCRVRTVFTNTVPVDAYRGAGRPEAAYVVERLVDAAARKLGMTPDAIRRKNFIAPRAMPYKTATGKVYDSGDFTAHMKRAMEIANWKEFPKRAKAAKKQGLVRGIGLATYVEVCGTMGEETAKVQLDPNGDVSVLIGTQSSGQGHQTAYAQLVAEQFGLSPERVHVFQGDTDQIATGLGTGGSASIPTGGVSVERATRELGANLREIAAEALETSAGDLGDQRGHGADRRHRSLGQLCRSGQAHGRRSVEAECQRDVHGRRRHLSERHAPLAEVEIDPATGIIKIVNYIIVDDFGVTLNPLLLAGQVHGGAMQGIGQALMEQAVYDPKDGQLVTGTFMDYALPRAADGPSFRVRDP